MTFQINPVKDIPVEDTKLLGHENIVQNLKNGKSIKIYDKTFSKINLE